jgi:Protein of unknown function (DUF2914)
MYKEDIMLKKTLFVLLSALILSGVCFAQADPSKEQMKDTTSAEPAKEQMKEPMPAVAQEQPKLVLEEIQIATAVEDRQPTGAGTVFPDDLDKIYCFTKIGGAEGTTYVTHVWYFGNAEIARVKLPVKSKSWRTWSSKKLNMGLGNGHVEIVSESGDILGTADFEIQAAKKAEAVEKPEMTEAGEKAKAVEKPEMTEAGEKAKAVEKPEKTMVPEETKEMPKQP